MNPCFVSALPLLLLLGGMGAARAESPSAAHQRALAAVEKGGGIVRMDLADPRKPALAVSFVSVTVSEPAMRSLKTLIGLRSLTFDNARLADSALKHLSDLKILLSLGFHNTPVTDTGLKHLQGLTGLRDLDLTYTKITDAGLAHLKGLAALGALRLDGTEITDAGLNQLAGLKKLRFLSLNGTAATGARFLPTGGKAGAQVILDPRTLKLPPKDRKMIALLGSTSFRERKAADTHLDRIGAPALNDLRRAAADSSDPEVRRRARRLIERIEGRSPEVKRARTLAALKKLRAMVVVDETRPDAPVIRVDFKGSGITDSGLAILQEVPHIEELDLLCQQRITDVGLAYLKGLTHLRVLILSSNHITDVGLAHLKGLKNLKRLRLWSRKVTSVGIQDLQKALPGLKIDGR